MTQQGVKVDKSRSNFLMFVMLSSTNPQYDPIALGDYASRNILPELQAEEAMRRRLGVSASVVPIESSARALADVLRDLRALRVMLRFELLELAHAALHDAFFFA